MNMNMNANEFEYRTISQAHVVIVHSLRRMFNKVGKWFGKVQHQTETLNNIYGLYNRTLLNRTLLNQFLGYYIMQESILEYNSACYDLSYSPNPNHLVVEFCQSL